jgi:phospholipase C
MSTIRFRSAQFSNVYLRIDGTGVTHPVAPGAGVVNCQYGAGPWETHELVIHQDGTVSIASTAFPNVFLRLDGSGLTRPVAPGGGVANCQYTAGPYEKFLMTPQPNGSAALASVAFPGVFLRLDGTGVTQPSGSGGGTVNGQFSAGPFEQFYIEDMDHNNR